MAEEIRESDRPVDQTDLTELRKQAAKRATIIPGAGFALLGQAGWAWWSVAASLLTIGSMGWLLQQPHFWPLILTLGFGLLSMLIWCGELWWVRQASRQLSPAPQFITNHFGLCVGAYYLVVMATVVMMFVRFKSFVFMGDSMRPAVKEGDRIVCYRQVEDDRLRGGHVIIFHASPDAVPDQRGRVLVARILAGPGDRIAIWKGRYVVNSNTAAAVANAADDQIVLSVPREPDTLKVPADSYFCTVDSPQIGSDSRSFSWVRRDEIISTRLWLMNLREGFKQIN